MRKDQEIEQKDQEIEQSKQALNKKNEQLQGTIRMLTEAGVSVEVIAQKLSLSPSEVKNFL